MIRDEVLEIVRAARKRDEIPDLNGADLRGVDLHGVDLRWANLSGIDLSWANLTGSNLTRANLTRANLAGAAWDGFCVDGIHPYRCLLVPTPDGWTVTIGCWSGTVGELRGLIAGDQWPESTGDEITRLRPALASFCDMCDAHIFTHPAIDDLVEKWSK